MTAEEANRIAETFNGPPRLAKDHESIQYQQVSTTESEFCGNCRFWLFERDFPTGVCTIVEPPIAQGGWCKVWEAIKIVPLLMIENTKIEKGKEYKSKESLRFEATLVGDKTGSEWKVQLIDAGMSMNNRIYPLEVLHRDGKIFEGVPVHATVGADHNNNERGFLSIVGIIKNVENNPEGISATLHISNDDLKATMLDLHKEGVLNDIMGLSIVADGIWDVNAQGIPVAEKLTEGESVDLVRTPAAGGKILEVTESKQKEGIVPEFTEDQIKEMMQGAANTAVATLEKTRAEAEAEEKAKAEAAHDDLSDEEKKKALAKKKADDEKKAKDGTTSESVAPEILVMREILLTNLISEAKLPEVSAKRIKAAFSGEFEPEKVQEAIKLEKEYIDSLSTRVVESLTKENRLLPGQVGVDERDKKLARFDAIFEETGILVLKDGTKVHAYRNFTEAKSDWEGVNPFSFDKEDLWETWKAATSGYRGFAKENAKIYEALDVANWGQVFADRMHKALIDNYGKETQYQDWRKIARVISNRDFLAHRNIKVGGYANLPVVVERGTYPLLTAPGDEETTTTIEKRGGIADQISREAMINDDLGALARIPRELSRSAARTLYRGVFIDILVTNPNYGPDSVALFNATHNNTGTTAMSIAGVDDAQLNMRDQTRFGSTNDILGAANLPKVMVVPNELQGLAQRIANPGPAVFLQNTADADAAMDTDRFKGQLEVVVVDDLTDATEYFLIADPQLVMGLVVAFLNGREEPELFIQQDPTQGEAFSQDVQNIKIRHEWNVGIADFRPLFRQT